MTPQSLRVFGHRGASGLAPENTIPAFDRAIELGADGLELDVRLSADAVAVVHHDASLSRTTNGTGLVSQQTAETLAGLDAGYRFAQGGQHPFRGRGARIPRLEEVLRRYPGVRVIVEMKLDTEEMARVALEAVRAAGALECVCFASAGSCAMAAIRTLEPRASTSASRREIRAALYRCWLGAAPRRPGFCAFQVPERSRVTRRRVVSPRFVRAAHRAGVRVEVWTVNQAADMRRLLEWGVDGLITDRPDLAVPLVAEWRRRVGPGGNDAR